jgi:hypothetical protein
VHAATLQSTLAVEVPFDELRVRPLVVLFVTHTGYVRASLPLEVLTLAVAALCLAMLSHKMGWKMTSHIRPVLDLLPALIVFNSVLMFNRPKWLVPPPLRQKPGLFQDDL